MQNCCAAAQGTAVGAGAARQSACRTRDTATGHQGAQAASIKGGTAKVTVDGTPYSVTEGESFASGYRAVDINSECASFESGTTSFTLCEGEAVLK